MQQVLQTLSNEKVGIKDQVAKYSFKKWTYRINQPPNPQPPNTISNEEADDEDEEEATFSTDESQHEQIAKLNEMWDFVLPISDNENEYEALPISTRSKGPIDPIQPIKQRPSTSTVKDKVAIEKSTSSDNLLASHNTEFLETKSNNVIH